MQPLAALLQSHCQELRKRRGGDRRLFRGTWRSLQDLTWRFMCVWQRGCEETCTQSKGWPWSQERPETLRNTVPFSLWSSCQSILAYYTQLLEMVLRDLNVLFLSFLKHLYMCLCACEGICVCPCAHGYAIQHSWRSEDSSCVWLFPFYHMDPKEQTQVVVSGFQLRHLQGLCVISFYE